MENINPSLLDCTGSLSITDVGYVPKVPPAQSGVQLFLLSVPFPWALVGVHEDHASPEMYSFPSAHESNNSVGFVVGGFSPGQPTE